MSVATGQAASSDGATERACAESKGERWIPGVSTTDHAANPIAEQVTPPTIAAEHAGFAYSTS
jgi:hypothetical protein